MNEEKDKYFKKKKHKNCKTLVHVSLDIPYIDRLKVIEDYYDFLYKYSLNANSIYALIEYKKYLENLKK